MEEIIKPGIYQHFKGGVYFVIGVAKHTETMEDLVVYINMHDDPNFGKYNIWVRPLPMFLDEVDFNGQKVLRFKFLSDKL